MRLDGARRRLLFGATWLAVALGPLLDPALGAQPGRTGTFVAGVADAETGQPLEGAEVILLDIHRLARANQMGEARIDGVPRGPQRVRVRKLGYVPSEITVAFSGDTTGAVFRLPRSAIRLGTIDIEADWVPPKIRDMERRQRMGIGRFLNAEVLDKDRNRDFGVLVSARFPGIRLVTDQSGRQHFTSSRGSGTCPITTFLDDVPVDLTEDIYIIKTWDLAAVEYYSETEIPVEYRSRAPGCGLLLAWSKWY
jgi:hypothetical protein